MQEMRYSSHGHHAGSRIEPQIPVPSENDPGFRMSKENMEQFLENYRQLNYANKTISGYAHNLKDFYDFLPEDKMIRQGTLKEWRDTLIKKGYVHGSVNTFLKVANKYLDFFGQQKYRMQDCLENPKDTQSELSRAEYLRMLRTAKELGDDRAYLLIKLLATTGMAIQELPKLTVEAVKEGKLIIDFHHNKYILRIPEILQKELLNYIKSHGYETGSVFTGRGKNPLSRVHIFRIIRSVCEEAYLPEEKGNPLCLRKLYQSTQMELENNVKVLVEQAYNRLLEEEQLEIGWNNSSSY